MAVRRPAPPLHDPASADRGHGLHRRVRRLVQNRFLTYVSLIRNTVGLQISPLTVTLFTVTPRLQ